MMVKIKSGRSPIHSSGDVRQDMWGVIRDLRIFTIRDITDKTKTNETTIHSYLMGLLAANIISKDVQTFENKGSLHKNTYTLQKDTGVDAPRVRKDGSFVPETAQSRMWKAIRILKIFSLPELIATASTEESIIATTAADTYLKLLRKAGYLIKKKSDKKYRISPAMNHGVKAPQIQKINQIYDPNIKKVVWSEGGAQ